MALVNNSSYIPTTNDFLSHWAQVDEALSPGAFVLPEEPGLIPPSFNRSGLVALRTTLLDNLQVIQDKLNDVQIASGRIRLLKQKLYARLNLFLEVVDGFYASTEYLAARPDAPGITAGEERFVDPLRDMKSLWAKLNAAPAPAGLTLPIILQVGTPELPETVTLAQFNTMLDLLVQRYQEHGDAEQALTLARSRRDKTMKFIRAVLISYRTAVLPKIAGNQPLIDTIPRVTPEPGHTPDPVQVSAAFVAPNKAVGSYTESDDGDFKDYQIVAAVGEDATLEDAIPLETRTARTPAPFETTFGLGAPDSAISLWVIVRTKDGNERASDKVVVHRPA